MNKTLTYPSIIQSIKNNIFVNQETTKDAIVRFSVLQSKLIDMEMPNVLLLGSQAKKFNVSITDIRTYSQWQREEGREVKITNDASPMYIFTSKTIDNENFFVQEAVYDFQHTTAKYLGIGAKNPVIEVEGNNREKFFLDLISLSKEAGYGINENAQVNNYLPYIKKITINSNETTTNKIYYLIKQLSRDKIFGDAIRSFEKTEEGSAIDDTIVSLVASGVLSRFSIELNENINITEISNDIETCLMNISRGIKSVMLDIKLNEYTQKQSNLLSNQADATSNATVDNYLSSVKPIQERKKERKTFIKFKKLTDTEIDKLKEVNMDRVSSQDPASILVALDIEFKTKSGGYIFTRPSRSENTASCHFGIDNGVWKWTDFGDGQKSGNMLSLIQESGISDFKEALKLCMNTYNINDVLDEAFVLIKLENNELKRKYWGDNFVDEAINNNQDSNNNKGIAEILQNAQLAVAELKKTNEVLEKISQTNSRVIYASNNIPKKFKDMMCDRGIHGQVKEMLHIKGEVRGTNSKTGEKYKYVTEGVGILCGDENTLARIYADIAKVGIAKVNEEFESVTIGGDIHFPEYINRQGDKKKTTSFGFKDLTYVDNEGAGSGKIAVFESKNDYYAAAEKRNFKSENIDIVVTNGTGRATEASDLIRANQYDKIIIYNQFDIPGTKFISDVMKRNTSGFEYLNYESNEFKQDPNDLLKNGIHIEDRFRQVHSIDQIGYLITKIESYASTQVLDQTESLKMKKEIDKLRTEISLTDNNQPTLSL